MKRRVFFLTALALVFIAFLIYLFTAVQHQETSVPRFTKHKYNGERLLLYPQVHGINKKAAARINEMLEKAAQNSYKSALNLKRAETFTKDGNSHYSYNSAYNVINNKNGKLSILYRDYMYTGGSNGSDYVTLYNFDLSTGQQYEIKDILKTSAQYKKVKNYAFNYLSTHEPYAKSVSKLSDFTVNKDTQISLYDHGIYLVFQDGEIKSYPDGYLFIKIPESVYK
ncbi:DUF4163 domain-containing protein [Sporolactobacillus sp. STSJ-5]|uniref:DUF4163 domain-containing protein n=1 Tax=Sporolactobacillus sp. STSJ-5 TaxID=2965076 RepID=UPI0021049747|nr:DUF4163 domain-containing protein [Sporolactobacillus sp. STSJ-5]MCQ2011263.1 DUF4163 domain-containing protein [Sporolactobacillus sp. STSJ-5]